MRASSCPSLLLFCIAIPLLVAEAKWTKDANDMVDTPGSCIGQDVDGAGSCRLEPLSYGVDVSFPMHHEFSSTNNNGKIAAMQHQQDVYREFMQGCRDFYPDVVERCELRCCCAYLLCVCVMSTDLTNA